MGKKKICEYVLLFIPLYIFVSEKARKKTVLRVSITALKMLFGSQKFLSLEIETFTLIWTNIFMLVVVQQNLPLKFINCKLILLGFLPDVLDDSQHVAVTYVHFRPVTKGWQRVLVTLFLWSTWHFIAFVVKHQPTICLHTHNVCLHTLHVRVIFNSLLLSLGLIDLMTVL